MRAATLEVCRKLSSFSTHFLLFFFHAPLPVNVQAFSSQKVGASLSDQTA
jgi:hypothetical protein